MTGSDDLPRCAWAGSDPDYIAYHDHEWGRPLHDDRTLFEMLCLEGAQAGLSWLTILKRRDGYRAAFDNFRPQIIADYDEAKLAALAEDTRIVRNRLKIRSVVQNAQAYLAVVDEFGSFDSYIWGFVGGQPKVNCFEALEAVPATTPESIAMSKDLKKRGFSFVGPTICYAYMQACGLVNDHHAGCYLYPCD